MIGEEDWIMRPVLLHLCSYESLLNGALSLLDVSILNEAIDVERENQRRLSPR